MKTMVSAFGIALLLSTTALAQQPVEQPKPQVTDELKTAAVDLIKGLRSAVETGVAFASEQIPLVLWEKVMVDRVFFTLVILSSVIAIYFSLLHNIPRLLVAIKNANSTKYGECEYHASEAIVRGVVGGVIAIISIIAFCENFYSFALVWFAPRLYLIEWVRSLV